MVVRGYRQGGKRWESMGVILKVTKCPIIEGLEFFNVIESYDRIVNSHIIVIATLFLTQSCLSSIC